MHFEVRRLDSDALLEKSFRLRFDVFCRELGYPASPAEADVEWDAFDPIALHFGALDRSGDLAGTVRLVPNGERGLPLLLHCLVDAPCRPLAGAAEVSRLAISPAYRRRRGDGLYGLATDGDEDAPARERRAKYPEIVLGLYKALYQASKQLDVTWWYAAMERALARQLRRFNVGFEAIGPEVDYHGPVVPFRAAIAEMESSVLSADPELFRTMTEGIDPALFRAAAAE